MNSESVTGAFALGGVIVGAALNVIVGVALDRRRKRRDTRAAMRLLVPELEALDRDLRLTLRTRRWTTLADASTDRWQSHEAHLADSLPEGEWASLMMTIYTGLRVFIDEAQNEHDHNEIEREDLAHIRLTHDVLLEALAGALGTRARHQRWYVWGRRRRNLARQAQCPAGADAADEPRLGLGGELRRAGHDLQVSRVGEDQSLPRCMEAVA